MSPEFDADEFKRRYPKLSEEIFGGKAKQLSFKIHITDPWRNYIPTVVDYVRRCKTVEEAFEVIDYLVKRNELTQEEAEEIKKKLKEGGIEAFGGRKEDDYYYKQAKRYWGLLRLQAKNETEDE